MAGAPADYVDVATRIVEFREKYPEGCLRPADLSHPYRIETVGGSTFLTVVAAAYRSADDPCPGVGMAQEPIPGPTNFTRDSELQNAETSAWGRAIIAVGAADAKKGVASANEVRNRQHPIATIDDLDNKIHEALEAGVEGDYDAMRGACEEGPHLIPASLSKLDKAIAAKAVAA